MRISAITAILGFLLIFACDLYIFFDIRRLAAAGRRKLWMWVYAVFAVLCWALMAAVLLLPKRDAAVDLLPVMWMLFTVISLYVPKFIYCICSIVTRWFGRRASRAGALTGLVLGVLSFIILWWGALVTRRQIVTNEVEIISAKLPASFDGLRVLQFSDAHVGTWGNDTTFVSALVDSINVRKADIILFTGDIVNRQSNELEPFIPVFSRLKAPLGVYAILGNHDYAGYVDWPEDGDANRDVARLGSMIDSMGWTLLKNQTDFIKAGNDSIVLIGVENWGEPPFNQLGNLGKSYPSDSGSLHGLNDGMFKILLTHNPEHWSQVATKISNIDLTLSGHTHAMQMMLKAGNWKWSPSQYRYPQWGGLYTDTAADGNPMNLYVNIGVGEVGFPARIGAAKPELTVITLKRK